MSKSITFSEEAAAKQGSPNPSTSASDEEAASFDQLVENDYARRTLVKMASRRSSAMADWNPERLVAQSGTRPEPEDSDKKNGCSVVQHRKLVADIVKSAASKRVGVGGRPAVARLSEGSRRGPSSSSRLGPDRLARAAQVIQSLPGSNTSSRPTSPGRAGPPSAASSFTSSPTRPVRGSVRSDLSSPSKRDAHSDTKRAPYALSRSAASSPGRVQARVRGGGVAQTARAHNGRDRVAMDVFWAELLAGLDEKPPAALRVDESLQPAAHDLEARGRPSMMASIFNSQDPDQALHQRKGHPL